MHTLRENGVFNILGRPSSKRIDMEEKFARQDLPSEPTFQPIDYTAYPKGDAKVSPNPPAVTYPRSLRSIIGLGYPSKSADGKKRGLIPQEGLNKRKFEVGIHAPDTKQDPIGKNRPVQSVGILSYADRFFKWLNEAIGG